MTLEDSVRRRIEDTGRIEQKYYREAKLESRWMLGFQCACGSCERHHGMLSGVNGFYAKRKAGK